jgi:hypothetical protein
VRLGVTKRPLGGGGACAAPARRPLEGTADYQEGIAAFFERRPAIFTGT